jgi:histidinol-phosphate aminotransferase
VPYKADHEDPDALIAAAWAHRPKLVYLSNPDNPMGSHHPAAAIMAMINALPPESLMILDEAYIDLAPPGTAPQIAADDARVIRFRTFSKGYGMAGLRVGYAICAAPLAVAFDKIRNHFGVGRIAQAGALAALADQAWLAQVQARVASGRERLAAIARANGASPLPSATNFVTMDLGRDGDCARATLRALTGLGVFVRMPGVAPLDRCLRVSVGDDAALAVFEEVLPQALKAAG